MQIAAEESLPSCESVENCARWQVHDAEDIIEDAIERRSSHKHAGQWSEASEVAIKLSNRLPLAALGRM